MIARAKISAVRASGMRLLLFMSQMRRLIEGGAYSSKYGSHVNFLTQNSSKLIRCETFLILFILLDAKSKVVSFVWKTNQKH